MKVDIGSLEEAVLEVVQVKAYALLVKLRLRVADREVQPSRTAYLYVRQLPNSLDEQFLLFHVVTPASIATALQSVKECLRAQVLLQIAHLILACCEYMRHGQLTLGEMLGKGYEGMVLLF